MNCSKKSSIVINLLLALWRFIISKGMIMIMGKREENLTLTIEKLREMLGTMNYGSVTLVVQDNLIVQIEKNEKIRLK